MEQRHRTDKGYWLLDISIWTTIKDFKKNFESTKLKYNEDIYLYKIDQSKRAMTLWEAYRIHTDMEITINHIGTLQPGEPLEIEDKWERRGDMQGAIIRAYTIKAGVFVIDMIPSQRDTIEITGIVADVLYHLQVCVKLFMTFFYVMTSRRSFTP